MTTLLFVQHVSSEILGNKLKIIIYILRK